MATETLEAVKQPMYVHCGQCRHEWVQAYLPMSVAKLTKLMKAPCPKCGDSRSVLLGQLPRETVLNAAEEWIGNGDTGTSSMTIWSVLMGRRSPHGRFDVPYDPSDFGRCYRLLKVMPEWIARLPEVATAYPRFAPFVREWAELTRLYEHELEHGPMDKKHNYRMAPQTYELCQRLRAEADAS